MAITLTQGTVEYLQFPVVDNDNVITTLVGTGPVFDVKSNFGVIYSYYTAQAATTNALTPMTLYCLIDTSTSSVGSPSVGGMWLPGDYKLWFKLTTPPGAERPRLGPFGFTVQT